MNKPISSANRIFRRWEPYLGILISTGVFSWLGKRLQVFGNLGWPEAIFIGAFAGATLSFSVAACLIGWRYFKPLESEATQSGTEIVPPFDDTKLLREFGALSSQQRQIIDDYQRMSGLEARFVDMLDALKSDIQARDQTNASNLASTNDRLAVLLATQAAEIAGLKDHQSLTADAASEQFESIYLALAAIFHRERLHAIGVNIEGGAAELNAATNASKHYDLEQWNEWEKQYRQWMYWVDQWTDLAEGYYTGIKAKVLTTTDDHYKLKGVAKVEQFPDAEAYIAYKAFCAIYKNWCNWQEEAYRAVHQRAFNSGNRRMLSGAGDMEELGATGT